MINGDIHLSKSSPDIEAERLAVLAGLQILDTPPEREFDTIVHCARRILQCKMAFVSLVDDQRQWFKAKCGLDALQTPREQAFCAHAVESNDILVVPDARLDPRFADNPLVVGAPNIRFYAGVPIRVTVGGKDGRSYAMGTLCVIDDKPRQLAADDAQTLHELAHLVESLLSARVSALITAELAEEQRRVLQKLDLTLRQFHQAERMANMGSWRLTLADNCTEWSDQVYAIHGLPVGISPPLDPALEFYPPHARPAISAALAHTVETGQPFDIEADFVTAKGDHRRVRSMGELELLDGEPVALIGVFQDITAWHAMEQALRRTVNIDDLTRLASRPRFNEMVDEKITAARRCNEPMALLLIDLDNFKMVNDRCGHLAGDDLLRLMASRLEAPYLADCFAARLGGDEFVLLVTSPKALSDLAGLLRQLLEDLRHLVAYADGQIQVSGTIGASWLDDTVRDRSDLLHRADLALYEAKREQRGSAKIYGQNALILLNNSKRAAASLVSTNDAKIEKQSRWAS